MLSFSVFSQNNDHIITLKGDTLIGKISISTTDKAVQRVTVKNGKDKKHFKAYELKGITKGNNVYHTIKISNKYQLGMLVKDGYLSLYKYVNSESSSSNEFSESILIKKDGAQMEVPNLGFRKQLGDFLGDCETVQVALTNKEYSKGDLLKLIDDYNTCIEEKTAQMNSTKPAINLNPEKSKLITSLISEINNNDSLEDRVSILEMLNDLDTKVKTGATIPGYLKNALRDSLKSHSELTKQLNEILE